MVNRPPPLDDWDETKAEQEEDFSEGYVTLLQSVVQQIGLIPTKWLEDRLNSVDRSFSRADSIGVMLDPTGWMADQNSGHRASAEFQRDILSHILSIRKIGQEHDDKMKEIKAKNQPK